MSMIMMRTTAVVWAAGLLWLGCSASTETPPEAPVGDRVEISLGPLGGKVANGSGVTLEVPEGALAATTTVTIDEATMTEADVVKRLAASGVDGVLVSKVWQLAPPKTAFSVPATLTLPHTAAAGSDVVVAWFAGEGGDTPAPAPGSKPSPKADGAAGPLILTPAADAVVVTQSAVTFQIGSLGIGAVIQRTTAPTCQSFDGACSRGCSYATDKDCCQAVIAGDAHIGASRIIDSDADGVHGIALGDVTGDGLPDIVAALENRRRLVLYPSDTKAGFASLEIVDAGVGARDVTLADVDGDGDLDLASALGDDGAALYLNAGDGTFEGRSVVYPHGLARAQRVKVADLNGDGKLDVLLSTATGLVSLAGDGAGAFATPVDVWGPVSPRQVAGTVADVDGDAVPDLLVTWYDVLSGDASLSWHKGTGGGAFDGPTEVSHALERPYTAVFADVDADGKSDLVVADSDLDQVLVYPGLGAGQFALPDVVVDGLDGPQDVIVTNLDGDAVADIVVAAANDDEIDWFVRTGPGKFALKGRLDNGMNGASAVVAGDADGDGDLDLAYAATTNDRVAWFVNGGICQCQKDADCDDDNPCTTTSCDVAADRCKVTVKPGCCNEDSACSDGDVCTADKCTTGNTCASSAIAGCCKAVSDCTANDCHTVACVANSCKQTKVAGCCVKSSDCDDGKPCTTDACTDGKCVSTPGEGCCQSNAACDDGLECTKDECKALVCVNTLNAAGCPKAKVCEMLMGALVCDRESLTTNYCVQVRAVRKSLPPAQVASAEVSLDECLTDVLLTGASSWLDADCQKNPVCVIPGAEKYCALGTLEHCTVGLSTCDGGATGGTTGFSAPLQLLVPSDPVALAAADLDGDAAHEVIVATETAIWRVDMATGAQTPVDESGGAVQLAVADLDGGGPDVVAVDTVGALVAYRSTGGVAYERVVLAASPGATSLAVADLDGDGDPDVVTTGTSPGWFQNPGVVTADWSWKTIGGISAGLDVSAMDLDGDGDVDVAVRTATDVIYVERTGPETWSAPASVVGSAVDSILVHGTKDGPGVLYAASGGKVTAYTFPGPASLDVAVGVPTPTQAMRRTDLDGDKDPDLLAWGAGAGGLSVRWYESKPSGAPVSHTILTPGDTYANPTGALPVVADVNGDGQADLVAAFKPGRLRAYLGKPMCCAKAEDCEDDDLCTIEICKEGGCAHTAAASCCTVAADCDDDNVCTTEACTDKKCVSTPTTAGTSCGKGGYCDGASPPACASCTKDAHCSDDDACTTDACSSGNCKYTQMSCDDANGCTKDGCTDGECTHAPCGETTMAWNALGDNPSPPEGLPYKFPISGWAEDVTLARSGDVGPIEPSTLSVAGSLASEALGGAAVTWSGDLRIIGVLGVGQPLQGSVTFDFGGMATDAGAGHRFVLAVGGTGGPVGEGPTTIQCNVSLTLLGHVDAYSTNTYATFEGPSTLKGSVGAKDGLTVFVLPKSATSVKCTIVDQGTVADLHAYAVGLIDTDVDVCKGSGAAAECLANACGDGLVRAGEACDDANAKDGDGCSATCQVENKWTCAGDLKSVCTVAPGCGNKIVESGEKCDDGNEVGGDGCNAVCQSECSTDASCDDGLACTKDVCTAPVCQYGLAVPSCPKPAICESLMGALACDKGKLATAYCESARTLRKLLPASQVASAVVSLDECLTGVLLTGVASPIDADCQKDPACVVKAAGTHCASGMMTHCTAGLSSCDPAATAAAPGFNTLLESVLPGDATALAAGKIFPDGFNSEDYVFVGTDTALWRVNMVIQTQDEFDVPNGVAQVVFPPTDFGLSAPLVLDSTGSVGVMLIDEVIPFVGVTGVSAFTVAQMDGILTSDVVVTGATTGWYNINYKGGSLFESTWHAIPGITNGLEILAVDYDNDNDMDVVVRTATGIVWVERTGPETWAAPTSLVGTAVDSMAIYTDPLGLNGYPASFVYAASGSGLNAYYLGYGDISGDPTPIPKPTQAIRFGNLDGVPPHDALLWSDTAGGLDVSWWENKPTTTTIVKHTILEPGAWTAKPTGALPVIADVNGDGQQDVVGAFESGRVVAFVGKPACCTKAADCDDAFPCTTDTCEAGACVHKGIPACCATDYECTDTDLCTTDTCEGNVCKHAPLCADEDGCTIDTCKSGSCTNTACDTTSIAWNSLNASPKAASEADPFTFLIPLWSKDIGFYRTGTDTGMQSYTPPETVDGSFESDALGGVLAEWSGDLPYIDVLGSISGTVNFDFGGVATELGAGYRFVLAVGGTGGDPGEGPVTITCNVPLTPIGTFDAFGTGAYAAFQAPSTLVGSVGKIDGLSIFVLPKEAKSVSCTLSDAGTLADTHGYAVGLIDTDVTLCKGDDAKTAQCIENTCGDGLVRQTEGCDDGNTDSGDGCSATCTAEAGWACAGNLKTECKKGCGDGVQTGGEGCDDGNTKAGDGCSATCAIESGWVCSNALNLNTGSDGKGGQAALGSDDLLWTWKASGGTTWAPAILTKECVASWQDAPAHAQWVSRSKCASPKNTVTDYRAVFTIPSAGDAKSWKLSGTVWADDQIVSISINGTTVTVPAGSGFSGAGAAFGDWPSSVYKAGENVIIVSVSNANIGASTNPDGLLVSVPNAFSKASTCQKSSP